MPGLGDAARARARPLARAGAAGRRGGGDGAAVDGPGRAARPVELGPGRAVQPREDGQDLS